MGNYITFVLCFLWVSVIICDNNVMNTKPVPAYEIAALEYLWNSTDGPSWKYGAAEPLNSGSNWSFPPINSPCGWQGLQYMCNESICNVVEMLLHSTNLNGQIPSQIQMLSSLKNLDLSRNMLRGTDLAFVCGIQNLTSLTMSWTFLSNNIPTCIGGASSLSIVQMQGTNITGTIPSEIGDLSGLVLFNVRNSLQLSGSLPSEFCRLEQMAYLDVGDCRHNGTIPPCLGQLTKLYHLSLDLNSIEGSVPTELGNLVKLTAMYVGNNCLDGTIPLTLMSLPQLLVLGLNNNFFVGPVPIPTNALFMLETVPQLVVQIVNNTSKPNNTWSVTSLFSTAMSVYMALSGVYRFGYFRWYKGYAFEEIPIESVKIPGVDAKYTSLSTQKVSGARKMRGAQRMIKTVSTFFSEDGDAGHTKRRRAEVAEGLALGNDLDAEGLLGALSAQVALLNDERSYDHERIRQASDLIVADSLTDRKKNRMLALQEYFKILSPVDIQYVFWMWTRAASLLCT